VTTRAAAFGGAYRPRGRKPRGRMPTMSTATSTTMTERDVQKATKLLSAIRDAIVDTVRDAGANGVPESYFCLVFMEHSAPPSLAQQIVDGLVNWGILRHEHHRIYLAKITTPENVVL
jgi:hypothetical protein